MLIYFQTCTDRLEGNYCGCGTWYEASVLEVIPKADAETIYYIKYTVDGEEETVSGDNIRRLADAKSMDSTTSARSSSFGTDDGIMSVPLPDLDNSDTVGELPQAEKSVSTPYEPKLSVGDDGAFVPDLYEGMALT